MSGAVLSLDAQVLRTLLEELGESARGHRFAAAPNPCVGAAIVAGSRVVARGYHEVWGGDHAEVNAIRAAESSGVARAEWDALVVTLEPCSSEGKTPPCTRAILAAGIKTVVVGALDPDPRHRGKGLEELREAGVDVRLIEGASRLDEIAPHFLRWTAPERLRRPRPWTIAKWAQTLSGHLSPPKDVGDGRWINGPEALGQVQKLRGRVDAIVTGVGTVLADDPRLTVRAPGEIDRPPARVVLDSVLRTPPDAKLFAVPGPGEAGGPVHVICQNGSDAGRMRALVEAGAIVSGVRGKDRRTIRLRELQSWLWDQGFRRVLLETGPKLLQSYLAAGFVDQVRVVTGGVRGGRGASLGPWLAGAKLLEREDSEIGGDAVLEAFLDPE